MFGVKRFAELKPCWQADMADHVIALAWSPGGTVLAAAAVSGLITLFDGSTGKVRHHLPGHEFGTTALGFSRDGVHFASSGQDGKVRLWDQATGQERLVLDGGAPWVERLAWCPVDNLLATSAGRRLRLWDPQGRLVREYPEHSSTIADIQWKPRSRELASASYSCVSLWTPDRSEPLRQFRWKGSQLVLAWSPDGKYLATGDQDCTVHFWIVKSGEDLQMSGYPRKVRELAWDCGSRFLATGGGPAVCVWDCGGSGPAGSKPQMLMGHREESTITAVAFQHRGHLLGSAGTDGQVCVWHPGNKKQPLVGVATGGEAVTCLAWSPDDALLAVGYESGAVAVLTVL